ncbi:MAG: hypothetical protein ACR2OT_06185 [Parvibaculales bacterium]
MKNLPIMFMISFLLLACATTGEIGGLKNKLLKLSYGDPKEKILSILGQPYDRTISGPHIEIWRYIGAFPSAANAKIVIKDGKIEEVSTY